jgi:hypothetical protein
VEAERKQRSASPVGKAVAIEKRMNATFAKHFRVISAYPHNNDRLGIPGISSAPEGSDDE